jgi:CelD/BcsL family acetyltransferase involved in cellulose biosynthesis
VSKLELLELRSIEQLRQAAPQWDDLWQRSEIAVPVVQAELLAQWLEHFAPRSSFHALIVADQGRFIAALPLRGQRRRGILPMGVLPANEWSCGGDLLLDRAADADQVCAVLAAALNRMPWPLLWLVPAALESPRWRALLAAASQAGMRSLTQEYFRVGQIELGPDWDAYEAGWSGNHRRHMRKAVKRLEREGGAALRTYFPASPEEVEVLLRRGFEIEDRSWKSAMGSSVLRSPGIFEMYCRQAQELARRQQLLLTFLEHAGHEIAFEFGYCAKGTYFSPKVGYDEQFAHLSPGQVLRYELLKKFSAEGQVKLVDFWGPLSDATAKWTTGSYPVGRVLLAPRRWLSRSLMKSFELVRSLRPRSRNLTTE